MENKQKQLFNASTLFTVYNTNTNISSSLTSEKAQYIVNSIVNSVKKMVDQPLVGVFDKMSSPTSLPIVGRLVLHWSKKTPASASASASAHTESSTSSSYVMPSSSSSSGVSSSAESSSSSSPPISQKLPNELGTHSHTWPNKEQLPERFQYYVIQLMDWFVRAWSSHYYNREVTSVDNSLAPIVVGVRFDPITNTKSVDRWININYVSNIQSNNSNKDDILKDLYEAYKWIEFTIDQWILQRENDLRTAHHSACHLHTVDYLATRVVRLRDSSSVVSNKFDFVVVPNLTPFANASSLSTSGNEEAKEVKDNHNQHHLTLATTQNIDKENIRQITILLDDSITYIHTTSSSPSIPPSTSTNSTNTTTVTKMEEQLNLTSITLKEEDKIPAIATASNNTTTVTKTEEPSNLTLKEEDKIPATAFAPTTGMTTTTTNATELENLITPTTSSSESQQSSTTSSSITTTITPVVIPLPVYREEDNKDEYHPKTSSLTTTTITGITSTTNGKEEEKQPNKIVKEQEQQFSCCDCLFPSPPSASASASQPIAVY